MSVCAIRPAAAVYAIARSMSASPSRGGSLRGLLLVLAIASSGRAATLDTPVHAVWSGLPLAEWAARVSLLAGRPVILDRRVDPDVVVHRECHGETLAAALVAVAATAGATPVVLDGVVWIAAPAEAAAASRTEAARKRDIAGLPADRRRIVAAREPWSWPAGVRPRALVAEAAARTRVVIEGLDSIPHDHLPAAWLPALSLGERLDLVLAHYDLRVAWLATGPAGRIVPVSRDPAPAVPDPLVPDPVARDSAAREPSLRDPAVRRRPGAGPSADADVRFTLRLEAPLEEALTLIARQLGLALELDRTALEARGISPREIVRASVSQASRAELLDAITEPVGLAWTIDDGRLRIGPTRDDEDETVED